MKKHIVSFSGGKDSSAMLLRMIEMGMPSCKPKNPNQTCMDFD